VVFGNNFVASFGGFSFNLIMKFTHLHTHSHYSLLDGLSKIDELVNRAKEMGMESLALTDHGVMYGAIEFYKKAKKAGIKPIIGCEIYVSENGMHQKRAGVDDKRYHLILLSKNETGYKNLIKIVSSAHLEGFYYKPRVDKNFLRQHSEGLIALSACLGGELSRAIASRNYEKAKKIALEHEEIFGKGNYYIELQQHPNIEDQNIVTPQLVRLARDTGIPMVATQDSHYTHTDDAHAHDVLLAVQTGNKLDDTDRLSMKDDNFALLSGEEVFEKFRVLGEDVAKEALENSEKIASLCDLEIELGKTKLPTFPLPEDYQTAEDYLKKLSDDGLIARYGDNITEEIKDRLEYELKVIKQTGFAAYFLIVQDFVNWAKQNGIVVGPGRGSAAGSLVSYLLNITNIDPLKYNLLFERFLNPERISMPDIDLDFDDARRDEVLKYVAEKYGQDHVSQIITFGTMAARGSIRDAGRALGFSYDFCDKVAKMIPLNPNQGKSSLKKAVELVDELKQAYNTNLDVKKLIDAAAKLEGVARHSSTHACAVVITPEPLTNYLPLQRGTNEEDVITQYEMHAVEDLGLLKMDFLGLANLTIIHDTLNEIKRNHNIDININDIPLNDKKTFRMLQAAKSTGVFQLESDGMKRYLKELRPTELEDLIAMVSLYRPGPMELIPQYIARKHGKDQIRYLHPKLEPIFKNTYGVMVYQEQLIEAVKTLAGFSIAEADVLRKAVGKKIKKLLDEQEDKFKSGAKTTGIPDNIANEFWSLVEPFNRYAFNRSHAACYAMIAYQTAYLKASYPTEFMAAFMNSETGDVERIAFLIEECKSMGIEVLPPDINQSFEKFAVVTSSEKPSIRFGLTAVKNVGHNVVTSMIRERQKSDSFKNIDDFINRIQHKDLNKKSLESLIKCGALDSFGERNTLIANVDNMLAYARESQKNISNGQVSLFGDTIETALPSFRLTAVEPAKSWEKLLWEKELLGLFVSDHPLNSCQPQLKLEKVTPIKNLSLAAAGSSVKVGGVITRIQKIVTKTGRPMIFSHVEDLTSKIELVVFPNVFEKNPEIWKENNIVIARGKVNDRDGALKLLCDDVKILMAMA
jgi:DNA polymerase III subunit alpha